MKHIFFILLLIFLFPDAKGQDSTAQQSSLEQAFKGRMFVGASPGNYLNQKLVFESKGALMLRPVEPMLWFPPHIYRNDAEKFGALGARFLSYGLGGGWKR